MEPVLIVATIVIGALVLRALVEVLMTWRGLFFR